MIYMLLKQRGLKTSGMKKPGYRKNYINLKSGMTLIELMVVMALSLILVGAAFMAHIAQSKMGAEQSRVTAIQQDIRAVIDMIDRDVRNSGCNPRDINNFLALNATSSGPNSVALNMDLNGDRDANDQNETVVYRLNGNTLERSDQGVSTELTDNVSLFQIIYRNANNQVITPSAPGGFLSATDAENVLSIEVTIEMQGDVPDANSGQYTTRRITRRMQSRNQEIVFKH